MSPARRLEQSSLVAAMFAGSIGLWAGAPAFWLWLAGRRTTVSHNSMTPILMVIVGIPVTMVLIGKLLARVDHVYSSKFGAPSGGTKSMARLLRSVRGGSDAPPSMLDKIMIMSLGLALAGAGVWFVFFSHGSAAQG